MLKNYLVIALRNLTRQKFYAGINIMGLAIGVAGCLLILLYIVDELSYDRFHTHADRIYRVVMDAKMTGQQFTAPVTSAPMARALVEDYPEVEAATRLFRLSGEVTRYNDIVLNEKEAAFADANFFEVFSFPLREGDPRTVLTEPQTVVLSRSAARKYFGSAPAVGQVLTVGDFNSRYTVTGVMEDMPHNSHMYFDMLMSMASFEDSRGDNWMSNSYFTYVLLRSGVSKANLEAKFPEIIKKYIGPLVEQFTGLTFEQFLERGDSWRFFLQPLPDIYLKSNLAYELRPTGDIRYVYILSAVALFIILIACINFMNLATARAARRAKEVGIRKVVGSVKRNLIGQFLIESLLYSVLATLAGLALAGLLVPGFNEISGKSVTLDFTRNAWILPGLVLIILLVGLVAGSYPAFYLTSFRPIDVLKGKIREGVRSSGIRSGLVVFQFAISITLIICTWSVYQQLQFLRNQHLGFTKENVVVISNAQRLGNNANALRQSLLASDPVVNASYANGIPADSRINSSPFRKETSKEDHIFSVIQADYDYLPTLGIELAAGRNFSREFKTDTAGVLLNEAAVRQLGWSVEEAVDKPLDFVGADGEPRLRVLGIIKNYNFESLHHSVKPLAILLSPTGRFLSVRVKPGNAQESIRRLESEWKKVVPDEPFEFAFLDDTFDAQFRAEQRLGTVFGLFTGLAIFIACLGLFGLASYITEQRAKEIGVRKVLGASEPQIVVLLSKDFTRLVLLAFMIAAPLAWYAMHTWLENFAYHINLSPLTFLLAGMVALAIAWLTLSYQAIKAALMNPVKSLRSE
jgi:putative ABC transport system permease protein